MNKSPHVFINLALWFKDYPKEYLGETSETWGVGKEPQPLHKLLWSAISIIVTFYMKVMKHVTVEEINGELDLLTEKLSHMRIKENDTEIKQT